MGAIVDDGKSNDGAAIKLRVLIPVQFTGFGSA